MSKLVRREFVGSRLILWLLLVIPFMFPLGIVYLLESTVTVHTDMEDPEAFMATYRS